MTLKEVFSCDFGKKKTICVNKVTGRKFISYLVCRMTFVEIKTLNAILFEYIE